MKFSKEMQSNDNFEGLRVIGFRISASPQISKEIHALLDMDDIELTQAVSRLGYSPNYCMRNN